MICKIIYILFPYLIHAFLESSLLLMFISNFVQHLRKTTKSLSTLSIFEARHTYGTLLILMFDAIDIDV